MTPKATESSTAYTPEELQEFLHCWQLPGGVLAPDQTRALLAWNGTPEQERKALLGAWPLPSSRSRRNGWRRINGEGMSAGSTG